MARDYARVFSAPVLDLDTIAWDRSKPGIRAELTLSLTKLDTFMKVHEDWIVEGCYADLISAASGSATELVFLNPGIQTCIENCKSRPWEDHKYSSQQAQDKNLKMLIDWVAEYEVREDEYSLVAHRRVFEAFAGQKVELNSNESAKEHLPEVKTSD